MDLSQILAGIQDETTKSKLTEFATEYEKSQRSLSELQAKMAGNELVPQDKADGWKRFNTQWETELKPKLDRVNEIEAENARLKAERDKLKPEAERAAILAAQIEQGTAVDPDKILALGDERYKGKFVAVDQIDKIVERAVNEAKRAVDFGSLPTGLKLLETADKARREYGLEIPLETMADATTRFGGIDKAYSELTREARGKKEEERKAAEKAKYEADIAEARRQGALEAQRAYETNSTFEESGGAPSSVVPMVPHGKDDGPVIDPTNYDPSQGVLAREAAKKLQALENTSSYKNLM